MAAGKLTNNESREAVAAREVGRTAISWRLAVLLSTLFLLVLFAVPVAQYARDRSAGREPFPPFTLSATGPDGSLVDRIRTANNGVLRFFADLEEQLEENSFLRRFFLPPLQEVFLRILGEGNRQVVPGRAGTLFYAPDIEAILGPPFLDGQRLLVRAGEHDPGQPPPVPDPRPAILSFHRQLAARGITLILLPVAVKPAIEPEKLTGRPALGKAPLANRSWPALRDELAGQGVRIFSSRTLLRSYAEGHGAAFLATDSHWLPGAMETVARQLAAAIAADFPDLAGELRWQRRQVTVASAGDIAGMLTLTPGSDLYPAEEVSLQQVYNSREEYWQPEPSAPILLLGDSFSNIYSFAGLGWGQAAGLAEQLSFYLQSDIDLLARNDDGAFASREMLATELGRGRDRLAGKKLVIWQFAERELALGDWRPVRLELAEPAAGPAGGGFYLAPAGNMVVAEGVVASISRSPRPGSVPYRDNLLTLHLLDMQVAGDAGGEEQALVYAWGMRDNRLTPIAGLRPGDQVRLSLRRWDEVVAEYGGFRRTALADELLELELPNWGSLLPGPGHGQPPTKDPLP